MDWIVCPLEKPHGAISIGENVKSHGSLTVRFGAIVFGLGTFAHFIIELLVFLEHKLHSPCRYSTVGANTLLILLFITFQTSLIFMYPRLNFDCHHTLNK